MHIISTYLPAAAVVVITSGIVVTKTRCYCCLWSLMALHFPAAYSLFSPSIAESQVALVVCRFVQARKKGTRYARKPHVGCVPREKAKYGRNGLPSSLNDSIYHISPLSTS